MSGDPGIDGTMKRILIALQNHARLGGPKSMAWKELSDVLRDLDQKEVSKSVIKLTKRGYLREEMVKFGGYHSFFALTEVGYERTSEIGLDHGLVEPAQVVERAAPKVPEKEVAALGWLHLTDLHWDVQSPSGGRSFWPTVQAKLLGDIQNISRYCKPIRLILFSGDIAFSGEKEQYESVTAVLERIVQAAMAGNGGERPIVLCVPGNHDLIRPDVHNSPKQSYLEKSHVEYLQGIFSDYSAWNQRWTDKITAPGAKWSAGILPGDFRVSLKVGPFSIGIVGLNSAFQQLQKGDYRGKLCLESQQLHGTCGEDAYQWSTANGHALNFIMTHHGQDWLSDEGKEHFLADVAPLDLFAVQFFGHEHDPNAVRVSVGDRAPRRLIQGASLFSKVDPSQGGKRVHGYSAGKLSFTAKGDAWMEVWPRVAIQSADSQWSFSRDEKLCKGSKSSYIWDLQGFEGETQREFAPMKQSPARGFL